MFARPIQVRRRLAPLDEAERRRHKSRNFVHSIFLLGGIIGLLALCGWVLFGPEGLVGMALGAALALVFSPKISPRMVLRLYRAREIGPHDLPEVLRVLAHEISHIRNRDLWLMGIADLAGRLTRVMTLFGLALLFVGLPLWLSGAATVPWLLIPLLVFAPQITTLLQLALSRAREFDADLDAAGLTGDPGALASALAKLERYQRGAWEQILMPGRRLPEPSVLRTHPATSERIARLEALSGTPRFPPLPERGATRGSEAAWPMIHGVPRGRLIGFWY